MKIFLKGLATQVSAILIAALAAGLIGFIQSVAVQTGSCPIPVDKVADTATMGAIFKSSHTAFLALTHKHLL